MNPNPPQSNELEELTLRYCEGSLTTEQATRLREIVLSQPDSCADFIRWSRMITDLEWLSAAGETAGAMGIAPVVQETPAPCAERIPVARKAVSTSFWSAIALWFGDGRIAMPGVLAILALATTATAVLTAMLMQGDTIHRTAVGPFPDSQSVPVAYLTSVNGCDWTGASPLFHSVGSSARVGDEIAINEGIAEFRMGSGVSLGIEGPASLLLASPTKLGLHYGKVTVHVPSGAADFDVVIAGCRVTARDAEFAVSLHQDELEIHVFSGEVATSSSIAADRYQDSVEEEGYEAVALHDQLFTEAVVVAGSALRLQTRGDVLALRAWDEAKPDLFVTKLSMIGPLIVNDDYVEQVKQSKPVGYWRFEQIVESEVPNEIDPKVPLVAASKSELVGTAENRSAELRWDGDWHLQSKSPLPLKGTSHTIEAWVKPSHLHRGCIASLETKLNPNIGSRLELQGGVSESYSSNRIGRIRYVHRAYDGKPKNSKSCFSTHPYAVRRWQHMVVTKTDSDIEMFIDGKSVVADKVEKHFTLSTNPYVRVGVYSSIPTRRFIGQIDELAVYDRALTSEEVARHYQAASEVTSNGWPLETRSSQQQPLDY